MNVVLTLCLSILFYTAVCYEEDFYWKDYEGEIPPDAFPGGKDKDGKDTYIGQAYIHEYAQAIVQIFPGKREVVAPCYGIKKTSRNIMILCTKHPKKLSWVPTTAESFSLDTINLHPVIGGTDERQAHKGYLSIGRLMFEGILKIGAIASYDAENAWFYFPHENTEHRKANYDVLVYNHSVGHYFDNAVPCADIVL